MKQHPNSLRPCGNCGDNFSPVNETQVECGACQVGHCIECGKSYQAFEMITTDHGDTYCPECSEIAQDVADNDVAHMNSDYLRGVL